MVVSVCMATEGDYYRDRLVIENALSGAHDMEVELLVYELSTPSGTKNKTLEFAESLLQTNEKGDTFCARFPALKRVATDCAQIPWTNAYNIMFKEAKGDYFVILAQNTYPSVGWLHEMVAINSRVKDAGLISIEHISTPIKLFDIPDFNDEPVLVRQTTNNNFTGAAMFSRRVYEVFGGFDEKTNFNFYSAFYEELKKNGFYNVATPNQYLLLI